MRVSSAGKRLNNDFSGAPCAFGRRPASRLFEGRLNDPYTKLTEDVNKCFQEDVDVGMAQIAHIVEISGLSLVVIVMELCAHVTAENASVPTDLSPRQQVSCVRPGSLYSPGFVVGITIRPLLGPGFILIIQLALRAVRLTAALALQTPRA